jgi:YjjW family glycine radical enzyme activase
MNSPQATLSKILTYSLVDGPGNRLVLFMQGCNYACPACHNPHTIGQCNHCGECIAACPQGALSLSGGKILFNPGICDQCDLCLGACPISANPMVQQYDVEQILDIARKNRAFLSGVTVSGGEATIQSKFIHALFSAIKRDPELGALSCFIDSNGHLGEKSWEKLLPVTDGVMLDIKAFDLPLHQQLTGRDNSKSLKSAHILHQTGKLYELRFLLIPGKTDKKRELDQLVVLVEQLGGNVRVRLNGFQHHGVRGEALGWPKMERDGVERAAGYLRAAGVEQVVTPAVYF